jgi:hypothetical protein
VVFKWEGQLDGLLGQFSIKYPGKVLEKIDQIVADGSNALRNVSNRVVLEAMMKRRAALRHYVATGTLEPDEREQFVTVAVELLWNALRPFMLLAKAVKADHLLFAFDEKKEVLPLLDKGRVGPGSRLQGVGPRG